MNGWATLTGVSPILFWTVCEAPLAKNIWIISAWLNRQAWCKEVLPSLSGLFRSIFSIS